MYSSNLNTNINITKYIFVLDIFCQQSWRVVHMGGCTFVLDIFCQQLGKIYVSWRVSVNPLGAGLGNVNFVLDINCQHVGNIIQLKLYIKG